MNASTPPTGTDALVADVLAKLSAATADLAAAWRTPMLATIADGGVPTLRTVVLRSVDPLQRILRINTDRGSAKARQIARSPAVELCFWDPDARQQLRIAGHATIEASGPAADAAWSALAPGGRAIYRAGPAPGTPTPGPAPLDHPPTDPDGGSRGAFALVTVSWQRWDWVWLGTDAHRRARLHWRADGRIEGGWTVP